MAYFLDIQAPPTLQRTQRDLLVSFMLQVAKRFSFLGLQEWELLLEKKEKVLGIATEFYDLTKGKALENKFTIFFASKKDTTDFRRLLEALVDGLEFGEAQKQKKQDWMRVWRSHFKPLSLSKGKIWIYPAWIKIPESKKKKLVIRIHPGQAFGTGNHGTTSLCLEAFLRNAAALPKNNIRLLDFGAGTGILAIAAEKWAKKNARSMKSIAVEIDPVARGQAKINAKLNGVKLQIAAKQKKSDSFDLIFANVLAPVLLEKRDELLGSLAPKGILLLSGILWKEATAFQKSFGVPDGYRAKRVRNGDWALVEVQNLRGLSK